MANPKINKQPVKTKRARKVTAPRATPRKPNHLAKAAEVEAQPSDESSHAERPIPDILKRDYKSLTTREEKLEWFKAMNSIEPETPRFHGVIWLDDVIVWRGQKLWKKYDELKKLHPDKQIAVGWIDTAPLVVY